MTNRLARARSDYLLAHAEQPVDWWEWGDAPFAEARKRGVPVLVSVGYATCHWCHVMARESFSDPSVGARLAAGFVSIKVDREELPDVDDALMAAASAFTRSLGWPLTVFLTPDGLPFFAGSYFPPSARQGMPGFGDVLDAVEEAWRERPDAAAATGARVQAALRAPVEAARADRAALERALASIGDAEDGQHGGLGVGQKFPHAPVIVALAREGVDTELAGRLLDAVVGDDAVVDAGGFSHLRGRDGGCFRYATRRDWSEPHFERMLVDNAQLLLAATLLGRERVAEGIVGFLADVLRQPGGAFAIAEDAESVVDGERVEGGWHLAPGRERPAIDRLVVTAANGLAIEALATRALRDGDERALVLANDAADWVLAHHTGASGLVHASLDGVASTAPATAQDAGCLATGLLALARAEGDERRAVAAREILLAAPDPDGSTATGPRLALGPPSDGVAPGGPASLAGALLDLAALTGDDAPRLRAQRILDPATALAMPSAGASTIAAASRVDAPPRTVVLIGDPPTRHRRRDGAIVVPAERAPAWVDAGFALLQGKRHEGAYACEGLTCRPREDW